MNESSKGQAGGVLTPVASIGVICPTAPERIWLQVDPEPVDDVPAFPHDDDVTWCRDRINANDTLYIRADLTRPTPAAAADLHQQVMNLPLSKSTMEKLISGPEVGAYTLGHRDARHAAAELVAASPAAAADTVTAKDVAALVVSAVMDASDTADFKAAAGVPTDAEDVQRVLGYLRDGEAEIRAEKRNFVWADTMARASDLIRNLAASPVAPAGAPRLTDEQIDAMWQEARAAAMADPMGDPVRFRFARALLSAGSQGEQHDSSHEAARMLTEEEAWSCECSTYERSASAIQRKFREVNGIALSHEAAPQSSVASPSPRSSLSESDDSALPQWLPIATAPKDTEALFWIVPKPLDEGYLSSTGDPIYAGANAKPYLRMTKVGQWGCLWKATHWMPLPAPPRQGAQPVNEQSQLSVNAEGTPASSEPDEQNPVSRSSLPLPNRSVLPREPSGAPSAEGSAPKPAKLKVTLQDSPAESMFKAAVYALAEISVALGIPDEDAATANGNELILEAISNLRARPELLEALRYARRFLKSEEHDTAFVDAAIAKASGEQQ